MPSFLEVRELTKSFGSLRALDGVTLDVEARKVNILIGPNGSGKTTLINTMSGFYKADSGTVAFDGKDITGLPPYKVYGLGVARTFQIPNLFWKLTVLENVLVAEKGNPGESFFRSLIKGAWIKRETEATERALRLLDLLGLSRVWDNTAIKLSGGQMKLLELGRVLMSGARLILLDEPISGVNPTLAHEIFSRILKLRDELGVTFMIVEHRLDIALSYVDSVTAMAFGKVVATGKPELVMSDQKVIEAYLGV
ncbi:MAG TPA: ABC transporter ATP-binding protein [Nitrososphaerales archaeon]|nr:ABC transporter ATP-binding protein [Nitrososphaerales archaeon]